MTRQDKVGSAHVSIISVSPWNKYKDSLKPKFDLTAKDALKEVLPTTSHLSRQVRSQLAASLGLALPSSFSSSETTKIKKTTAGPSGTVQTGEDTSTETESRKPGDLSQLPSEGAADPEALKRLLADLDPDTLKSDPMLRYAAATALYQEVKLLETYLDSIASKGKFTPYLVRLKLTLMPSARYRPYDAYMNVSFLAKGGARANYPVDRMINYSETEESKPREGSEEASDNSTSTVTMPSSPPNINKECKQLAEASKLIIRIGASITTIKNTHALLKPSARYDYISLMITNIKNRLNTLEVMRGTLQECDTPETYCAACNLLHMLTNLEIRTERVKRHVSDLLIANNNQGNGQVIHDTPEVIPLVVSDSLEAAFAKRSSARQFSAALDLIAMIQGVGAKLSAKSVKQILNEFAGKDYNSLYSVSRLSANTVRVRMGAVRVGSNQYAMMTRSHFLTLLLLVPNSCLKDDSPKITLATHTKFLNALTGDDPAPRCREQTRSRAREIIEDYERSYGEFAITKPDSKDIFITRLLGTIRDNDYQTFTEELKLHTKFECYKNPPPVDGLWMDLLQIRVGSSYSEDIFEVPKPLEPSINLDQVALLYDDTQNQAWTTLTEAVVAEPVKAHIASVGECCVKTLAWNAHTYQYDAQQKTLKLYFPSLASWGVLPCDNPMVHIKFKFSDADVEWEVPLRYWKKKSEIKKALRVKVPGNFLVSDKDGATELALDIKQANCDLTKDKLTIQITNAYIAQVLIGDDTVVSKHPDSPMILKVVKPGAARLKLTNMNKGFPVKVQTFINGSPSSDPLELCVLLIQLPNQGKTK